MGDGWGNITTKLVLPDPVNPPDYICYVVRVPNSKYHITAFLGAIYDLSLWFNWQRDDAHTASLVAQVWRKVWLSLKTQNCIPPETGYLEVEGDCMAGCCLKCINGVLGSKDCDGNFVAIPGCGPSGASSTGPAPQPSPAGGQQGYFSEAWLDPDADLTTWRGPDGSVFFFGAYIPSSTELVGTDPLPGAPHMSLIALIQGVYYPLVGGTLSIPMGVSNAQVVIQANDSDLANNSGDVCFTLNVVNNQAATWSHTLDFAANSLAFGACFFGTGDPAAVYTPGSGFQQVNNPHGSGDTYCAFARDVAFTMTRCDVYGTTSGSNQAQISDGTQHGAIIATLVNTNETGVFVMSFLGNHIMTTGLRIDMNNLPDLVGTVTINKIHVEGTGFDPFA